MALPLPPTCFGANAKDANPKATLAKCGRLVGGDSITEHFPPISTWSRVASPVSCSASTRSGQFGYYFGPKPLICNRWILSRFTAKQLAGLKKYETLNQRVQGSSPCAPTILASRNNSTWKPAPERPNLRRGKHFEPTDALGQRPWETHWRPFRRRAIAKAKADHSRP